MKINLSFVLALLAFLISLFAVLINVNEFNFYIFIHVVIILISSFSLFAYSSIPFSLFKMFHIFNLFFMGIAPVLQFAADVRFMGEPRIPYEYKILTSLLVLGATILFNVLYFIVHQRFSISFLKNRVITLDRLNVIKPKFSKTMNLTLVVLSALSFFMIFSMNKFSVLSLMFRGGMFSEVEVDETNKALTLLITKFFRPMSLVVFIISCAYNKKSWMINSLLFLLFFVTNFPLGISRNAVAGFYLPLMLLFVPAFQRRHLFVSVMIFGLLVVFPVLDVFRYINEDAEFAFDTEFGMFTQMHFDAYITFARVIYHDMITYGSQLLGVFLFFVPRSIWPGKPLGSGEFHANELGMLFDNLACAYLAEGYINFGYIGVFLFVLVLGYGTAIIDKTYWRIKDKNTFFNVVYVLLVGMFLFVLRGDLLNGYAYTFGLIFTSFFVYYFLTFLTRLKL